MKEHGWACIGSAVRLGTSCRRRFRCLGPCPARCRQVFLYLDRAYVVNHPGTLSVFQIGLRQLRCQLEALPHVSTAAGHRARRMTCGRRLGPLAVGSCAAWWPRVVL